ncbi:MAG: hypothetical protein AB1490_10600 [Pseudomonadota bacterium]
MIYITENAFADPSRLEEWHAHYRRNIANLQTVPGFLASQRFQAVVDTPSNYCAVHDIASADMFESEVYTMRGGRQSNGDWQPLMIRWHRNLYDWTGETPEVAPDSYLLLIDEKREVAEREIALPRNTRITWLNLVGLDRTKPHRGVAIVDDPAEAIALAKADPRVKIFKPITEKIRQIKAVA